MQHPPSFDDGRPTYDDHFARDLVGKYVLVGLTYRNKLGEVRRQVQLHGVVVRADARAGIVLSLRGKRAGEQYKLPPQTDIFAPAPAGEYALRSTGEVVKNPDFTCTWSIEQPDA